MRTRSVAGTSCDDRRGGAQSAPRTQQAAPRETGSPVDAASQRFGHEQLCAATPHPASAHRLPLFVLALRSTHLHGGGTSRVSRVGQRHPARITQGCTVDVARWRGRQRRRREGARVSTAQRCDACGSEEAPLVRCAAPEIQPCSRHTQMQPDMHSDSPPMSHTADAGVGWRVSQSDRPQRRAAAVLRAACQTCRAGTSSMRCADRGAQSK